MCLGQATELHMAQLMPLPLTISCSSKSRLVSSFWCQLTRVVPDKIQEGCKMVVCAACVHVCAFTQLFYGSLCVLPTFLALLSRLYEVFFFPMSILFLLFPYCFSISLFYHHVFWCLHGPFDNPHVTCAVSIIMLFICCQCSITSRYFHSASSALSLTMLLYSSSFLLWVSIHALSVRTSYAIFLLY